MERQSLNRSKFVSQLVASLLLITGCSALVIFLYFPGNHPLGRGFDIAILYMITRRAAVLWAAAMIVFRLVFRQRISRNFFYVLCAVLNCMVGLVAIYLFFFQGHSREWLHLCLINLLLGAIMTVDGFLVSLE